LIEAAEKLGALSAAMAAGHLKYGSSIAALPPSMGDANGRKTAALAASSVSLLWRIQRRIGEGAVPIIQFVPCDQFASAAAAAVSFARAAAALMGRTLLIDTHRAMTPELVPDAYINRLYHQSIAGPALCTLLSQVAARTGPQAGSFSAIAIDQASLQAGDGACAVAPLCLATVLVVGAGATRLESIRAAMRRIEAVGGSVLGTVLVEPGARR
jgi:hypothetical protein